MVSSNNTAVENITKELPQIKSLGERYLQSEYLKPAAQKLAAKHDFEVAKGKRPVLYALPADEECWGLMAAAIGKAKNRKIVKDRLFFNGIEKMDPMPRCARV